MKINNTVNAITETNQTVTKSHTFEIGDQSIVIDILRNRLYSNPIQTLVQEYMSNARDANRESCSNRPLEVTLPTNKDLCLKIRDFGPGMSPERVKEMFTKYGNSTKRGNNSQTGGFGIGAKSAWAYTDAFTVISYFDGTVRHYAAHITKDKAGSLDLINETATLEPNGCEIHIPIKRDNMQDFDNAVQRACKYWNINEYPKFTGDSFDRAITIDKLGDFEAVNRAESDTYNPRYHLDLVIDGIPYPIPEEFKQVIQIRDLNDSLKCNGLLHFKTGQIEVSASREAVTNSPENQKLVLNASKQALKDINNILNQKIKGCHSLRESLDTHLELSVNYKHDYEKTYNLNYNSDVFTINYQGKIKSKLLDGIKIEKFEVNSRRRYSGSDSRLKLETLSNADFRQGAWFFQDDETSHAHQLRRIKPIAESKPVYILTGALNSPEMLKLAKHLNIKGTSSLGPASTRKSTKKESVDDILINIYLRPGSRGTTSKLVNPKRNKTTYVYAVKDETADSEYKQISAILSACDVSFCLVSQLTSKKVIGDSKFIEFKDFLKQASSLIPKQFLNKLVNNFKAHILDQGKGYGWHAYPIELYKKISGLKDLDLHRALNVIGVIDQKNKLNNKNNEQLGINVCEKTDLLIKAIPETAEYLKQTEVLNSMLKKYPLLKATEDVEYDGVCPASDLALYLNTAYEAKK